MVIGETEIKRKSERERERNRDEGRVQYEMC